MTTTLADPTYAIGTWTGNTRDDTTGVEWWVTTVDGWRSSPTLRAVVEALPGADGSTDPNPLYDARYVTINGRGVAPDRPTARAAHDTISALLAQAVNRQGTLTVTQDGAARSMACRLSGQVKVRPTSPVSFEFSFTVVGTDPRKYGPVVEVTAALGLSSSGLVFPVADPFNFGSATSGTLTATNSGTVRSWPVFRFTGPLVNPAISNPNTGDLLVAGVTLAASETLDVDCAQRTAFYQTSVSRRSKIVVTGAWLPLDPGTSQLIFRSDVYDPAALLTFDYRSAWI